MTQIEELRKLAPELDSVPDDTVNLMLGMTGDMVNPRSFGTDYDRACVLLAAHYITLWNRVAAAGDASDAGVTSGEVVMEKEGDLQKQYGTPSFSGYTTNTERLLGRTLYGQMFLALRARHILPVMTRMG